MIMLTCPNPVCKKSLKTLTKQCPHCRSDLTLLVDYVDHLQEGLTKADALARAGELGEAVWAYLEVLEVDPDNVIARRQVGRVTTAVRMFDQATPGRRWAKKLRQKARFDRKLRFWESNDEGPHWLGMAAVFLLALAAVFVVGYWRGYHDGRQEQPEPAAAQTEES